MGLIRVTEALGLFNDFSRVPAEIMEEAKKRGTEVHRACAAIARGVQPLFVPEQYWGYVKSFQDWFKKEVVKTVLIEAEVKAEAFELLGHLDLVLEMRTEGLVLLDVKTPKQFSKTWALQTAAYLYMARKAGVAVKKAGYIQLDANGGAAYVDWFTEETNYINLFLQALNLYRYFRK